MHICIYKAISGNHIVLNEVTEPDNNENKQIRDIMEDLYFDLNLNYSIWPPSWI